MNAESPFENSPGELPAQVDPPQITLTSITGRDGPASGSILPEVYEKIDRIPRPNPGFLISFCWFLALVGVQIAFAVVGVILIAVISAVTGEALDFDKIDETKWGGLILLASSQFATAAVALTAAFVHARKNYVERLQLRLPATYHWVFGFLAVIPVSILATEAAVIVGQLDGFSLKYLQDSMKGIDTIPFGAVLLFGCIFPGLFEELLFRSVMGRSMTQRYGLWIGIACASLLFGMAHVVPAHLVSSGIIGVFLHLAFINSRSVWTPVVMHTVNNAVAFTLSRYEKLLPIPGYTSEIGGDTVVHASPQLVTTAFFATLVLFTCWWYFRSAPYAGSQERSSDKWQLNYASGLGWLLAIGVLLTQVFLVVAITTSVSKN